jgi:hypothetical protein
MLNYEVARIMTEDKVAGTAVLQPIHFNATAIRANELFRIQHLENST